MQTIFEDKDERSNGRRAGSIDTIIYTERISRCVKRECVRRFGDRRTRIQVSVVATTRHLRTNDLTTSKALQWAIK